MQCCRGSASGRCWRKSSLSRRGDGLRCSITPRSTRLMPKRPFSRDRVPTCRLHIGCPQLWQLIGPSGSPAWLAAFGAVQPGLPVVQPPVSRAPSVELLAAWLKSLPGVEGPGTLAGQLASQIATSKGPTQAPQSRWPVHRATMRWPGRRNSVGWLSRGPPVPAPCRALDGLAVKIGSWR